MQIFGFTRYGGPEVMGHLTPTDAVPGPGQVLIRFAASGVNPADIKVRNGERQGAVEVRFPMAMGREASGVVVACGPGVSGFAPGERVFGACSAGTGALADLVILDAAAAAKVPDGLADEAAACIPVSWGTAYDALDGLNLSAGDTWLVVGAGGGVGTAALQLARAHGVRALGVASPGKRALIEECGGVHLAAGDGWPEQVRTLAPHGVQGVLDCVGGPELERAASLLAHDGRLLSVAASKQAAQRGGSGVTRRRTSAVFARIADLLAAGTLTPVISGTYPLAEAAEAIAAVESGHAAGKVVVVA